MKSTKHWLNPQTLAQFLAICCALTLHAQTAPTITTQPFSQTNLVGSNVTFTVAVSGSGPFTYQWQFNGTNLPNNIMSTLTGGGNGGFAGDGGPATNGLLTYPYGVASDAFGNLFVADSENYRVRKLDTNRIITTVAGNGTNGYFGDGNPATNASLSFFLGVAVDLADNLYIADSGNQRIRRVDTNGIITTVAGIGTNGYSGDGNAATNASLNNPASLAVDLFGNLFIVDANNNCIRKVDTNGIITTIAGIGSAGFFGDGGAATNASLNTPIGLAVDATGNIYIGDQNNERIRKVDHEGIITTIAGNGSWGDYGDNGPATNASLYFPAGVALNAAGTVYFADSSDNLIRQVDTNGLITKVAGTGYAGFLGDGVPATSAALYYPRGLAFDLAGNLYIADTFNGRIREVFLGGRPTLSLPAIAGNVGIYTVVVTNPYGTATSAVVSLTLAYPPTILVQPASQGVLTGSNATLSAIVAGTQPSYYSWYLNTTNLVQSGGNLSLAFSNFNANDNGNYTLIVTNAYGSATSQVAVLTVVFPPSITVQPGNQTVLGGSNLVLSVTVDGTAPFSYQWQMDGTNLPNNNITIITTAGGGTGGNGLAATNASLSGPNGVALDAAGNLYIADEGENRVRKVDSNGIITSVAGNGQLAAPNDGVAATNTSLNTPRRVALDAAGNLYVADYGHCSIRKVDTNGIIITVAGNGNPGFSGDGGPATNAGLNFPRGMVLDAAGNLYIADCSNNRVRKVDTNGIITTVAGNGNATYAGDGGLATNASLNSPFGVALDLIGNLYIADNQNNRIRKLGTNGIISTFAGNGHQSYSGDGATATNAGLSSPQAVALDNSGNLYIADQLNERIRMVGTNGVIATVAGNGNFAFAGDGGAATNASLNSPEDVALSAAGDLFIADTSNNRIRKVHPAGYPTLTFASIGAMNAGNYDVVITSPYGSVTSAIASVTVQSPPVITVQPATQSAVVGSSPVLSVTVAGTGPFGYLWYLASTNLVQSSTSNTLALPGLSTNNAGAYTAVVTNTFGSVTSRVAILTVAFPPSITTQSVPVIALAGTNVSFGVTVAGTGPLNYQWQLNGTNLPNNIITTFAGNGSKAFAGDGGMATNASLQNPEGVALDFSGNLYIADLTSQRIRKVDNHGIITTVAGNGSGAYGGDGGAAINASLRNPIAVALDPIGNLYIADFGNNRVRRVGTNGIITTVAGNGSANFAGDGGAATNASLQGPAAIALNVLGNLYIADSSNFRIREVDTNGIISTVVGSGTSGTLGNGYVATNAVVAVPAGVALDPAGNLYIASQPDNLICKVNTNGILNFFAGNFSSAYTGDGVAATNSSLNAPHGVALDAFGNLYIADASNQRIRKVDTNGIITTVAGNGMATYAGDGGPAAAASLDSPFAVALDAFGNLYIADLSNQRIRKVLLYAGYPTLTLGNVGAGNAGSYSVVITSPYGSVTSAVATLTVNIPRTAPQIVTSGSSLGFLTNSFGFNVSGAFGQTIVLDGSTNLVNWTPLVTNIFGSSQYYFFDPAWTNFPQRFYRARLP